MPSGRWLMAQKWDHLLFAHWRVPAEVLRPVIHPAAPIDTFDGSAWVGVTPFRVTGMRLRGTPPLPYFSRFLELNVRTYCTVDGKPGIWFMSLDAATRAAVFGARRTYRLPYFHAQMKRTVEDGRVSFTSRRKQRDGPPAELDIEYAPSGPVFQAEPGTLEHFLTERYCLYIVDDEQRLQRADIHHPPWPLQAAEGQVGRNSMADPYGVPLEGEPLLHYAARQDVVFWPRQKGT